MGHAHSGRTQGVHIGDMPGRQRGHAMAGHSGGIHASPPPQECAQPRGGGGMDLQDPTIRAEPPTHLKPKKKFFSLKIEGPF